MPRTDSPHTTYQEHCLLLSVNNNSSCNFKMIRLRGQFRRTPEYHSRSNIALAIITNQTTAVEKVWTEIERYLPVRY